MSAQPWTYPPDLRADLERFGLSPPDGTPPAVVRDALNDLYRYILAAHAAAVRVGTDLWWTRARVI
jgi:hypothetical protein